MTSAARFGLLASVAASAAALALSACGKQGELQRPPPLFGEAARAEYDAARERGDADAPDETSRREAQDEDATRPVPDPTEPLEPGNRPGSRPAPAQTLPEPLPVPSPG